MKVVTTQKGDVSTLKVEGRVDTSTAPELETAINAAINAKNDIVLDFAKVEYISSAGLRVLLSAQKTINAKKKKMKIVHVNNVVNEVFHITGFSSILTVE